MLYFNLIISLLSQNSVTSSLQDFPFNCILRQQTAQNTQGICEKYGKYRVIFDSLTQMNPDEVTLNHQTPTDYKAEIDFGKAKLKLLTNIYNWEISYLRKIIYLALANITACF